MHQTHVHMLSRFCMPCFYPHCTHWVVLSITIEMDEILSCMSYLFTYLSIYLSICLSIGLSIGRSFYLSIYLSLSLSPSLLHIHIIHSIQYTYTYTYTETDTSYKLGIFIYSIVISYKAMRTLGESSLLNALDTWTSLRPPRVGACLVVLSCDSRECAAVVQTLGG